MGFKIINSREYREVCERVAFLESDIDGKNRELEVKDEAIKRLKKELVQLQDNLAKNKEELRRSDELHGQARLEVSELRNRIAELESRKPAVINFVHDEAEKTEVKVEEKKTPRPQKKPRTKKDSK